MFTNQSQLKALFAALSLSGSLVLSLCCDRTYAHPNTLKDGRQIKSLVPKHVPRRSTRKVDCWSLAEVSECDPGISSHTAILIDTEGNGFALTDATGGTNFDMDSNGFGEQLAWTTEASDDAFLALDRNGNGAIENGGELFGNFTPQSEPPPNLPRNGFNALTDFDKSDRGGNRDGLIDKQDAIFTSLRLWRDTNHNGVSEPAELHVLTSLGIDAIELNYKASRNTDKFGNQFIFRAKTRDAKRDTAGRWAWNVDLIAAPLKEEKVLARNE